MGILITFLLGIFLLTGVLVVRLARGSKVIEQFSISIAPVSYTHLRAQRDRQKSRMPSSA